MAKCYHVWILHTLRFETECQQRPSPSVNHCFYNLTDVRIYDDRVEMKFALFTEENTPPVRWRAIYPPKISLNAFAAFWESRVIWFFLNFTGASTDATYGHTTRWFVTNLQDSMIWYKTPIISWNFILCPEYPLLRVAVKLILGKVFFHYITNLAWIVFCAPNIRGCQYLLLGIQMFAGYEVTLHNII